jgi:hypothetical protein
MLLDPERTQPGGVETRQRLGTEAPAEEMIRGKKVDGCHNGKTRAIWERGAKTATTAGRGRGPDNQQRRSAARRLPCVKLLLP